MSFYRRRLPHWHPVGAKIFVTWRLHECLPHKAALLTANKVVSEGRRFCVVDCMLDRAQTGPHWMQDPRIAACVVNTLFVAEKQWQLYELYAWVVMSNHVHLLLKPLRELAEVTRAIKKTSARRANEILGRSGLPFWQDESYDHWVRDRLEFDRIVRYIEWNPVRAGLVERVEDWPWSSAARQTETGQVGNLPH